MKNKKLIIGLTVALIVLAAAFGIVWKFTLPKTHEGAKTVGVTVVAEDKSKKDYSIKTDAEYLADALLEKKLITEAEHKSGFYTEIDGKKADYNKDKSWWCVTKDGKMTEVGMNEQPISDGDKFEIIYTVG